MNSYLSSPLQSVAALHHDSGVTEPAAALMGTGVGVSAQFNNTGNDATPATPDAKFDGFNF